MTQSEKGHRQQVTDSITSHSQVSSYIQIPGFHEMVANGETETIQLFYERVAQEIYNARKQNYSWGFSVIEPEFINFSDQIVLISKLYKEEHLTDLNSVIFKLLIEFNNIILACALQMHIPIQGIIRIGNSYRGSAKSRKPVLVSGKDPLILSDLLKVFTFGEIFPNGFTEVLIPAAAVPYHFGESLSKSVLDLKDLDDTTGIFMPVDYKKDSTTEVTILSNKLVEVNINGKDLFVCNWKEWMQEHDDFSPEDILEYAKAESEQSASPQAGNWKSLVRYYPGL